MAKKGCQNPARLVYWGMGKNPGIFLLEDGTMKKKMAAALFCCCTPVTIGGKLHLAVTLPT